MGKILTVNLPDIGEGVVEGEVIEWLKQPGDILTQDEPVVIVMTDKATVELPAPCPGTLAKQYFAVGQIAIKDKPLYDIQTGLEQEVKITENAIKKSEEKTTVVKKKKDEGQRSKVSDKASGHALAVPHTRQLAHELGVNINAVPPTGHDGLVTQEDVVRFHAGSDKCTEKSKVCGSGSVLLSLPGDSEEPIIGIKNLMAKKMVESHQNIPQFSYFESVEMTHLVQLKETFKEEAQKQGIKVTFMPFILKALSLTLKKFPIVNGSVDTSKNAIVIHKSHNIGIATTTKLGLIVPVLKNVDQMSLQEVIMAFEELKNRAAEGKLQSSDMKEATITVSNFGVLGGSGQWATPIVNYPEVAILGLARIQKYPVVRNNEVVVREMLNLSWSFDHRIIDGDLAASFSHHFCSLLLNPAPLI